MGYSVDGYVVNKKKFLDAVKIGDWDVIQDILEDSSCHWWDHSIAYGNPEKVNDIRNVCEYLTIICGDLYLSVSKDLSSIPHYNGTLPLVEEGDTAIVVISN